MEHSFSVATVANPLDDAVSDGFIEGDDDLLRTDQHDLAQLPPVLQVHTRRQQELGGGPVAAFARCQDKGCSACRDKDCGNREIEVGLRRLCPPCHHCNPLLCLLRQPCLSWPFETIAQFRAAQEAYTVVGSANLLVSPGLTQRQADEEESEGERDVDGAIGRMYQRPDQQEQAQHREEQELARRMHEVMHPNDADNISGITPRMDISPSNRYQTSPEPPRLGTELRRTEHQEDLSQLYGKPRLARGEEEKVPPIPASHLQGGLRPGPRLTSTPDRSVQLHWAGSQTKARGNPVQGWAGPRVHGPPPPMPFQAAPASATAQVPVQAEQGWQGGRHHGQPFQTPPQPSQWWSQRRPPSEQARPWAPPAAQQGQSHHGREIPPTSQVAEGNVAENQNKIVDVLQLMTDKLLTGHMIGGDRPPHPQLRLPNLSLPVPRKTQSGRVETKEYHLWRISLEKTIRNNNLSADAVLSLLATNVKLTSEEWLATFQSSASLPEALTRLDTMHAPIQHLYGQLIRQITKAPDLHGVSTKERIYQLNQMIQHTEEFITFFGSSTDLNREHIIVCLEKISDSKEGSYMSLRNIYAFDEAFRCGRPYCQSLKAHLIEARLLAVDLESALETLSEAEGNKSTPLRTAAIAAEPHSSKKGRMDGSGERGRQLGRTARAPRPPAHCHQCDQSGHMSYACPDLKKVKRGEIKLKAHLCPQCVGKVEDGKPHLQNCATKRLYLDNAYVLLRFTCPHNVHAKICPNPSCVEAKTKRILDPDQNPVPPPLRSYASRVLSLAAASESASGENPVAFLKELSALRGKDGQTVKCLVYYDSMGSKSFLHYKEGSLPNIYDWSCRPQRQTYSITTISGEQVVEKNVYEIKLVTVKGLETVTAVEGGLAGNLFGSVLDKEVADAHGIDSPSRVELESTTVVLILGSEMGSLMPRIQVPPRRLRQQYPGLMLATSVLSNRTLYFGPVQPRENLGSALRMARA